MTTAVGASLRERLDRIRRERSGGLAEHLMEIGRTAPGASRSRFGPPTRPSCLMMDMASHNDHRYFRAHPILRHEPEARACAEAIGTARMRLISAVNFVETAAVIDASRDPVAGRRVDDLMREARIVIEPATQAHARIARDAIGTLEREAAIRRD